MESYLPGKVIRDSLPRVFIGSWSPRYPLPSMYQNSKLPESINHIIYTNTLRTIRHSYHLRTSHINVGNCLPARTLAKYQLTNSLPKDSSLQPATLTIFCTLTIPNGQTDLNFSCKLSGKAGTQTHLFSSGSISTTIAAAAALAINLKGGENRASVLPPLRSETGHSVVELNVLKQHRPMESLSGFKS